jgi:hypothetical protein
MNRVDYRGKAMNTVVRSVIAIRGARPDADAGEGGLVASQFGACMRVSRRVPDGDDHPVSTSYPVFGVSRGGDDPA